MQLLPNAELAVIDMKKLIDYVLNVEHEEGKHKAYVFNKVLGVTANDGAELKDRILSEIVKTPMVPGKEDKFGKRYSVKFEWTRHNRTATVLTSWIIRTSEAIPRLTSCYIVD